MITSFNFGSSSTDNCYIMLYASERTRQSLSDYAREPKRKKRSEFLVVAANNRLTIGRYGIWELI